MQWHKKYSDDIDHYDDDDDDDDDDSLYININTFYIRYIFYLKESPVYGSIQRGDTVLSLYGCQVYNKQNWNDCISRTLSTPQHGYCTDMLTVSRKNSSQGQTAYIVVLICVLTVIVCVLTSLECLNDENNRSFSPCHASE